MDKELENAPRSWPTDVAEIYRAIADEDRRLAERMWSGVQSTWPAQITGEDVLPDFRCKVAEFFTLPGE
ncbi:MAG: hypothetical protein L0215_22465 [Gemmataceae bacterium]|nr:hypothetical protein [Gemmataceae bacterium]